MSLRVTGLKYYTTSDTYNYFKTMTATNITFLLRTNYSPVLKKIYTRSSDIHQLVFLPGMKIVDVQNGQFEKFILPRIYQLLSRESLAAAIDRTSQEQCQSPRHAAREFLQNEKKKLFATLGRHEPLRVYTSAETKKPRAESR